MAEVRRQLVEAKRDIAGFAVDSQPFITDQQLWWLMHRLGVDSDQAACRETDIDLDVLTAWLADPQFRGVYEEALTNKREAFRVLTTHMLPKAMKVIWGLLASPRENSQIRGLNLLLRTQALLIDKVQTHDPEAFDQLVALLRERVPAARGPTITVSPRVLPPAETEDA